MADVKYPKRWPFVASGIFMIFSALILLLNNTESIARMLEYGVEHYELSTVISFFAYPLLFFVLGVVIMASKNSIGTIVLLGIYTAQEVYWLIDTLKYHLDYSIDIYDILTLAIEVFLVMALVFLFLIALISRINQKSGFVNTWFIPFVFGLLSLFATFAVYIMGIVNDFEFEVAFYYVLLFGFINLHTLAIMFYGIGLKVAMNKKPAVKVVSGVNQYHMNANIRAEREQETNIPSFGANVQMPKPTPIMTPVTEASQERRPSDEAIEEMKKYKLLLDDGIITEEEFNRKKQQILGL